MPNDIRIGVGNAEINNRTNFAEYANKGDFNKPPQGILRRK
jgi:hypothetical protein